MKSYNIEFEIAGNFARFTDPFQFPNMNSYKIPTWSSAKGIIESVLYSKHVEVNPKKCYILNPIKFQDYVFGYETKGKNNLIFGKILYNVKYIFEAEILNKVSQEINEKKFKTTNPCHAYKERFERMIRNGQSFREVFLGNKNFSPFYFGPVVSEKKGIDFSFEMESFFKTLDYKTKELKPQFYNKINVKNGVFEYV